MANQVKIVGILWIVWGGLGLLIGLFMASILVGAGLIANIESSDPEALSILSIVATFIAGLFLLLSLPNIIAGIGIMKHQQWGRILGFILAALNLLSVPLGTALGVYTFYVLLSPEAQALFTKESTG